MQPLSAIPGFEPTQRYTAAQHNALPPGTRVNDYEIVRVLGEGGFSVVYLAEDRTLERRVAIKEYLPVSLAMRGEGAEVTLRTGAHADTFAQGLVSFINEARLLARFDHPSLVRVHHFWKANGTAYMVMPYIEGSTLLAARRAMAGPPDEAWLRELVSSLLGALDVLHEASCYHRDIAPDNILILHDGRPLLLDFGAARHVIGERTQQLTAILKPAFAPIEQYAEATHLQQGPWTDLYALGAVVRFCITGNSPMPSTVRAMHDDMESLANEVRALAREYPGVHYSAPFMTAIDWALSVRPADRPQSVQEFREALNKPYVTPTVRAPLQAAPPSPPDEPPVAAPAPQEPAAAAPRVEAQSHAPLSEEERAEAAVMRLLESVDAPPGDDAPIMVDEPWIASRPALKPEPAAQRSTLRQAVLFGLAATAVGALGAATWLWSEERQHANAAISAAVDPASMPAPSAGPIAATAPPATVPGTPTATAPGAAPQAVATAPTAPAPPVAVAAPAPQPLPAADGVIGAPTAAPLATAPTTPARTEGSSHSQAAAPVQSTRTPPATSRVADASGARVSTRARPAAPAEPESPRAACGSRQQFSLYYCMQTQCQNTKYYTHPQCVDLRRRDEVE